MTRRGADPEDLPSYAVSIALSHARRRFVLAYLDQQDGAVTVVDLARHLAAWEEGEPVSDLEGEVVESVVSPLLDEHLPALADVDLVTYDRKRDVHVVVLTHNGQLLAKRLEGEFGFDPSHYHVE